MIKTCCPKLSWACVCTLEQLLVLTWISTKHQQHWMLCHRHTMVAFCHYPIFSFVSYFQVGNHRCQLTLQGRWDNCASPLETSSIIIHCLLLQYVCPRWQEWEIHIEILFNSKTQFTWSMLFCKATQFSLNY